MGRRCLCLLDSQLAQVNIVIPTFASTNPPVQTVVATPPPQMPPLSYSVKPELNRMQWLGATVDLVLDVMWHPSVISTLQMPNNCPGHHSEWRMGVCLWTGRAVPRKGNNDDCKIFVGGLALSTTLEQLLRYFSAYGPVTDAVIMTDKMTGKPRGFAFICFETASCVLSVLQDHDKHHVNGKWVDVKRLPLSESFRLVLVAGLCWVRSFCLLPGAIADFLPGPRRMDTSSAVLAFRTGAG